MWAWKEIGRNATQQARKHRQLVLADRVSPVSEANVDILAKNMLFRSSV